MLKNTPPAPSSLTLPPSNRSDLFPFRAAFRLLWLPSTLNALSLAMHSAECCHCIPKSKFTPSLSSNLAALCLHLMAYRMMRLLTKQHGFGSDYLASDTPATALFQAVQSL